MTIIHTHVTFIICKRAARDEQRGTELRSNKVATMRRKGHEVLQVNTSACLDRI